MRIWFSSLFASYTMVTIVVIRFIFYSCNVMCFSLCNAFWNIFSLSCEQWLFTISRLIAFDFSTPVVNLPNVLKISIKNWKLFVNFLQRTGKQNMQCHPYTRKKKTQTKMYHVCIVLLNVSLRVSFFHYIFFLPFLLVACKARE